MNYYCGVCQNGSANAAKTNGETRRNDVDDGDAIWEKLVRQAKCVCVCVWLCVRDRESKGWSRERWERDETSACACCLRLHFNFISFHFISFANFCHKFAVFSAIFSAVFIWLLLQEQTLCVASGIGEVRLSIYQSSMGDRERKLKIQLNFFASLIDWLIDWHFDRYCQMYICIYIFFGNHLGNFLCIWKLQQQLVHNLWNLKWN